MLGRLLDPPPMTECRCRSVVASSARCSRSSCFAPTEVVAPDAPDRRVVGRAAAAERRAHAPGLRLAVALGVPPGRRRRRHPSGRARRRPPARRLRRAGSPPLRAPGRGGAPGARVGLAGARRRALARGPGSVARFDPLADLAFEPFARIDVERLEELRLAALEDRIDADLALGRHTALVPGNRSGSSLSTRCASGSARSAHARALPRPAGRPTR